MFSLILLFVGCGPGEWTPGDEDKIRQVVAAISDARSEPRKLAQIFVAGGAPDRAWLKRSAKWSFVVDEISISGEAATVQITIEDFMGRTVGATTWTCQRDGEDWRIGEAPLPD